MNWNKMFQFLRSHYLPFASSWLHAALMWLRVILRTTPLEQLLEARDNCALKIGRLCAVHTASRFANHCAVFLAEHFNLPHVVCCWYIRSQQTGQINCAAACLRWGLQPLVAMRSKMVANCF
jgi:hypothetical protein